MASSQQGLRLLALDGGGVKGLSELLILDQLMYAFNEATGDGKKAKPCDIFDVICGTSTGGLIAIMLGRLKLTVEEAMVEYEQLSKEVVRQCQAYRQ